MSPRRNHTFAELVKRDQAHLESVKGKSRGPRGNYEPRTPKPLTPKEAEMLDKFRPKVASKVKRRHEKWLREEMGVEPVATCGKLETR